MFKDRTVRTLALAAALVLLCGWLKPKPSLQDRELERNKFFARKVLWGPQFDIVLLGSSRTYCNVSPKAMQKFLTGYRIANFGFSGENMSPLLYREGQNRLDPESSRPVIVLGIDAAGLRAEPDTGSHLAMECHRGYLEQLVRRWVSPQLKFFTPTRPSDIYRALLRRPYQSNDHTVWHEDGWAATWQDSEDLPEKLRELRRTIAQKEAGTLEPYRLPAGGIDRLLEQVRRWRQQGVAVFAFRPPTMADHWRFEEWFYQFDQPAFVRRFEEAGGIWIDLPPSDRYHTYDLSHLTLDSAVRFSEDLAQRMADHLGRAEESAQHGEATSRPNSGQ